MSIVKSRHQPVARISAAKQDGRPVYCGPVKRKRVLTRQYHNPAEFLAAFFGEEE